jgi:hypothetical protein
LQIAKEANDQFGNPFEGLFGKSEEQRKHEIYAIVDGYARNQTGNLA